VDTGTLSGGALHPKRNAVRSGTVTLAPAVEPERNTEPPAPRGLEAPELLAEYFAKIGKGGLLTRRQEVSLSRKARSGDKRASASPEK
jgi:hypothetical protein